MRCNCGADRASRLNVYWRALMALLAASQAGSYGSKLNQLTQFGLSDADRPLLRPSPSTNKVSTTHVRNCRICWRA